LSHLNKTEMQTENKTTITVANTINAPLSKVWRCFTEPRHIVRWNSASPDWHTPDATNDLRTGGKFTFRMEAKDKSQGFDFGGTYTKVKQLEHINYTMDDGRETRVDFASEGNNRTRLTESFDAESQNPVEMQRQGWQAILDNFKQYVESTHLHYEITIDAPAQKVYDTMLKQDTYRKWTSAFNPTSHYEGDWKKGSDMKFIGTDDKGEIGGMISHVLENKPAEYISVEHRGIVKGKETLTSGKEVDDWKGAQENYSFIPQGNKTLLCVDMDSNEEMKSYFETTWPKALDKLKEICEN
jgi:uncharacterized protein YndB with AHSA1/START domain